MDQIHRRSTATPAVHRETDAPDLPGAQVNQTAYRSTRAWSWVFYKKNPDLSNITKIPFHQHKSFLSGPFLYE
jgi:hypothetical protein